MTTRRTWSGSSWEHQAGYCRAIRVGDRIWLAGTAATAADGSVASPGDMAGQAERCFEIIAEALQDLGAGIPDVVATRMYVIDIGKADEISAVHRAWFGHHPPVATLVEVAQLVDPEMLIEVEAEALVRD